VLVCKLPQLFCHGSVPVVKDVHVCLEQADVWPNLCHQQYILIAGKHMLQAVALILEICFLASLVSLLVGTIVKYGFRHMCLHTV